MIISKRLRGYPRQPGFRVARLGMKPPVNTGGFARFRPPLRMVQRGGGAGEAAAAMLEGE